MKTKYRIIETYNEFMADGKKMISTSRFIPQYKRLLFWHDIDGYTDYYSLDDAEYAIERQKIRDSVRNINKIVKKYQ